MRCCCLKEWQKECSLHPVKSDYVILGDFPESLLNPPPVPEAATLGCCPARSFLAYSVQIPTTVLEDVS